MRSFFTGERERERVRVFGKERERVRENEEHANALRNGETLSPFLSRSRANTM